MKKVNWGIIGCGDVCETKSGPAFYKCENSALRAVMRRDGEKAEDFAQRHNVPAFYTKAEDLINDPEVDVVYVATPPSTHALYTIMALESGKPVYVEKPMAVDFKECIKMLDAAKKYNQKLWVAYYRRSLPYFEKVKELIDNQSIGKIQTVRTLFSRSPLVSDLKSENNTWRIKKDVTTQVSTLGSTGFYNLAISANA